MNPSPENHLSLQRLRRLSRVLAVSCLVLVVALPVGAAVYWAVADAGALAAQAQLPPASIHGTLATWQRIAGALITEGPIALQLAGLWQARRFFRLFSSGQVFTSEAVRCLERFAGWVMASVPAGIAAGAAISVVLTLSNPPSMRHLAVSFGSHQAFLLLFAGMVWLMAGALGQARRLAEENATFV